MLAIKGKWQEDYNLGGEEEYNIHKLAQFIIKQTKSNSKIIVKDSEIAQPQQVKLDISQRKKFGYSPKIDVEEGVKFCIDFYNTYMKQNGMV